MRETSPFPPSYSLPPPSLPHRRELANDNGGTKPED
jgi:hypothetical protein